MSSFQERLKSLREQKKKQNSSWTQEFVANKLGVARVTYTAYENGTKTPPIDIIQKLADFFGVSTDFLLGRSDQQKELESEGNFFYFDKEGLTDEEIELLEQSYAFMKERARKRVEEKKKKNNDD